MKVPMSMAERFPEAELVLDDELVFDDAPRRSMLRRAEDRPEQIVQEGEVLAGKYRVERVPGRSGLGVVVQVRHMELAQEVTLKFLVPDACAYPEFVQRFVREARAAVKIQGEHVARVTDVGRLESGAPYMVREFLRGPDLAEVVKVRGRIPIEEAVDYIIQACEGVAEGHALGVVHRNLKPTSLVVTRRSDGTALVKVFDFAAAESLHVDPFTERSVQLVGTSAIMASLPYLSPEQIRDPHDVDVRADVYSLGAVLFELLCGQPVYFAESAPALLAMVAADAAPPLRSFIPDLPGELDHIVLRCLSKNRAIRYSSVAELALALRPFASEESTSSVERIVRLARISKRPELSGSRPPSVPAPAPASAPAAAPAPAPSPSMPFAMAPSTLPGRGPSGTVIVRSGSVPARALASEPAHDDVTTINPFAGYAAPVVIAPSTPAPPPLADVRAASPRHTPQPPPLRTSLPPPLQHVPAPHTVTQPLELVPPRAAAGAAPAGAATAMSDVPPPAPPSRMSQFSLPPRSSTAGMSRSWAVADEPKPPLFTRNRLIGAGVVAGFALFGAVFAVGRATRAPVAAAAAPKPPAAVVPPPAPAPPPAPPVVPDASSAALAPSAPGAVPSVAAAAPGAPAPVAAAPATAAPAPAPVAAAPAPVAPAPVAAAPAPAPRPPVQAAIRRPAPAPAKPKPESTESAPQAVAQKTARPAAGGDLFDDPR